MTRPVVPGPDRTGTADGSGPIDEPVVESDAF
jgi:hypothetical protein